MATAPDDPQGGVHHAPPQPCILWPQPCFLCAGEPHVMKAGCVHVVTCACPWPSQAFYSLCCVTLFVKHQLSPGDRTLSLSLVHLTTVTVLNTCVGLRSMCICGRNHLRPGTGTASCGHLESAMAFNLPVQSQGGWHVSRSSPVFGVFCLIRVNHSGESGVTSPVGWSLSITWPLGILLMKCPLRSFDCLLRSSGGYLHCTPDQSPFLHAGTADIFS